MPSMSDGSRDSIASAVQSELGDPTGSKLYTISADDINNGQMGPAMANLVANANVDPQPADSGQHVGPRG